jgi:hypothetical protein
MSFDRQDFVKRATKSDMLVVFVKKDKSLREMVCTLKPEVTNPTLKGGTRTSDPRDVTVVYDLEAKGWRSFRNDSVLSVGEV